MAYQIDPAHTGSQSDNLTPPLTQRWSRTFGGPISYPLIAEGKVFVVANFDISSYGTKLYALDQTNGAILWEFEDRSANYRFAGLAYDAGRIFIVNFDAQVRAFDASSGAFLWRRSLLSDWTYSFTAAPTAFGGSVFVLGEGIGARLFSLSQQDGSITWSTFMQSGGHSSPTVSQTCLYVSFANLHVTCYSPGTGEVIWERGQATGGGGKTSVLFNDRLYVRDNAADNNLVLNATTGTDIASYDVKLFPKGRAPAFSGSTGYFVRAGTLLARDAASLTVKWSFNSDNITTAPIVVNGYVYVGSYTGTLYALDANTGANVWSRKLGEHILEPDESNAQLLTGFAAANGLLVGSAENTLFAFQSAPAPIQMLLDTSGPATDQVTALDSLLFLRDPFPVVNAANLLNSAIDRNTRVILFVANLQLLQGETSSSVIVNLIDSNNQSYDLSAEDVRTVPDFTFTQVTFRLPNNLAAGTCTIRVRAHGQITNAGTIKIS
ncbi:MAG: hypothetical protein QOE77_1769 [Blastocatellia bacterium]|nr:hypothetical protein [Blastocatellia bacterium]